LIINQKAGEKFHDEAAEAVASELNWQKVLYAIINALQIFKLLFHFFFVLFTELKTEMQHKRNCTESSLAFQWTLYKPDTAFHLIS
jgi:hypothetical protein